MSHNTASEAQFRAHESIIRDAVERYPLHSEIIPHRVTVNTLRIGLINATKWLDENNYVDTHFNKEIYGRMRREFSIGFAANQAAVYWGPRRYKRRNLSQASLTEENAPKYYLTEPVDCSDEKTLMALCHLKNTGVLNGPVQVIGISADKLTQIELTSDIAVIQDEDKTLLL